MSDSGIIFDLWILLQVFERSGEDGRVGDIGIELSGGERTLRMVSSSSSINIRVFVYNVSTLTLFHPLHKSMLRLAKLNIVVLDGY